MKTAGYIVASSFYPSEWQPLALFRGYHKAGTLCIHGGATLFPTYAKAAAAITRSVKVGAENNAPWADKRFFHIMRVVN